jgi:hypothetical protein
MSNRSLNFTTMDEGFHARAMTPERVDGWLAYKGRPTTHPEPPKAPAPKKDNPVAAPQEPKPAEPVKKGAN